MAFEIKWAENALDDLKGIIKYLEEEWTSGVSDDFLEKCFSTIDLISNFPNSGIQSEKNKSIKNFNNKAKFFIL